MPIFIVILTFALGVLAGGTRQSSANQKSPTLERYEYRILKEYGVGRMLENPKNRDPFRVIEPPKELQDFLNKLGRDGWEVEDIRVRKAQSEMKANRQEPGYYLYSHAGETGPRFLRLRRRLN